MSCRKKTQIYVLQVINLRFCFILKWDKIRFAGSVLSYEFEVKRCEKKVVQTGGQSCS